MTSTDFRVVQQRFAAHLRDPSGHPAPEGIEERRLAVYRELFFNNIEGFASGFFPVLRSLYDDRAWQSLVRDFFARHRARTPYFLEIAEEFLSFLESGRGDHPDDPPFARELAHYEWLELVLDVATDEVPASGFNPAGDPMLGAPLLNPVAVLASYRWPVHRIGPGFRPQAPLAEPLFLLVHRDRDEQVRFLELNAVTARLFTLLREEPMLSGREAAMRIAAEIAHPDPAAVVDGARAMLAMLKERDIVLGTRLSPL